MHINKFEINVKVVLLLKFQNTKHKFKLNNMYLAIDPISTNTGKQN